MYKELILWLRDQASLDRYYNGDGTKYEQAADAIEELQKERDLWEARAKEERTAYLHWFEAYQHDVPKWISVEERMPEDLQTVLVLRENGLMYLWMFCAQSPTDEMWVDEYANAFSVYETTNWMPLPAPPDETSREEDKI